MKNLLYTGHNASYAALAAITVPRMESYALKHNMDFMAFTEPLIDVPNGIYWTGVCGALKAFEKGYDRAIYLDVDQLVTNFDYVPLPKSTNGFHASKDWGGDAIEHWHFSMCGFSASPDVRSILEYVLSLEPEWRDKPFPEQGPMRHVFMHRFMALNEIGSYDHDFDLLPRKVFNCVPDEVCPGNVPEPWAPGDWCAHLTMLPIEDRVKLAKEILSTL